MAEDDEDEDDEDVALDGAPAASGGGFHLGATQNPRRLRARGSAPGTVAELAAGAGGGEEDEEDTELASSMGLGKRRGGRQVAFLDPEEVAAGNRQDGAQLKAEAKADRRRVRKGVNRALRAEGVATAPSIQRDEGGDDSYNFGEFF